MAPCGQVFLVRGGEPEGECRLAASAPPLRVQMRRTLNDANGYPARIGVSFLIGRLRRMIIFLAHGRCREDAARLHVAALLQKIDDRLRAPVAQPLIRLGGAPRIGVAKD